MKCLVYADVNLNLIDGSSYRVQSVVEVLRRVYPKGQIVLLSREPVTGKGVSATLQKADEIDIRVCDQDRLQQARKEGSGTAAGSLSDILAVDAPVGLVDCPARPMAGRIGGQSCSGAAAVGLSTAVARLCYLLRRVRIAATTGAAGQTVTSTRRLTLRDPRRHEEALATPPSVARSGPVPCTGGGAAPHWKATQGLCPRLRLRVGCLARVDATAVDRVMAAAGRCYRPPGEQKLGSRGSCL